MSVAHVIVFLDNGGVMNNNALRGPQWQREIANFFVPLLGGTHEAWREANRTVADGIFEAENWQKRLQAATDFASFDRAYQRDWLVGMCQFVGVAIPPEEEGLQLSSRAIAHITRRVRADFPGVIETLRQLYNQGYTLHTASSGISHELHNCLEGMGVRDCFGPRLYGVDLLNTFKNGPEYYERLFADAEVDRVSAVVVDDSLDALHWASLMGARTVHVSRSSRPCCNSGACIERLAELPEILLQLDLRDGVNASL
jgi:FMN phosphatase YigB (HAD superfamily)